MITSAADTLGPGSAEASGALGTAVRETLTSTTWSMGNVAPMGITPAARS